MPYKSDKKSQQLGMPLGTAQNRLRRILFFNLLVKYNENICFRCKELILSSDDLHIDHKEPWIDASPELFWDTSNIAYSHAKCNCSARRTPPVIKPLNTDGQELFICRICKKQDVSSFFIKDPNRYKNISSVCKDCKSIENKKRY